MASAHLVLDACDFCRSTTAAAAALLSQAPFHSVWPSTDSPVPSENAGMQPNQALLADPLLLAATPPEDADSVLRRPLGSTSLTPDETHMVDSLTAANATTALLDADPEGDSLDERCRKRITELRTAIKEDEDHYRRLLGEIADIKRGKLDAMLTGKVTSGDREANCQSIVSEWPVTTCRTDAVTSAAEDNNGPWSPQSETGRNEAVEADELCDGQNTAERTRPTTPENGVPPQFPVSVAAPDDLDGQAGILPGKGADVAIQIGPNGRVEQEGFPSKRPRGRPPLKRPLRQCTERSAYSATRGRFRKLTCARRASSFGVTTRKMARRYNEVVDVVQHSSTKVPEDSRLEPQRQIFAARAENHPALNLEVDMDVVVASSENAGPGCGDQGGPPANRNPAPAVSEPSAVVTPDVDCNGRDAREPACNHDGASLIASAQCSHVVVIEEQGHGDCVDGVPLQLKKLGDKGKRISSASVRDSDHGTSCGSAAHSICHENGSREHHMGQNDSPPESRAVQGSVPPATARPRQRPSRLSSTRSSLRTCARAGLKSSSGLGSGPSRPLLPNLQPSKQWRDGLGEIWNVIASQPEAAPFLLPMKKRENMVYFQCVRHPMCLKDVKRKLDGMQIATVSEFRRDVLLVCANAIMFDPDCCDLNAHARKLFDFAEKCLPGRDGSTAARRPESPSVLSIAEAAATVPPDKRLTLLPSWRPTTLPLAAGFPGTAV